ncbi:unnamed protein product, partial [Meganyctiphanes norvegica]
THAETALEIAHSQITSVPTFKMVSIRAIVVLAILVFAMAMTSEAAPMFFQRAFARARANDRGAGSFAGAGGRGGRRIGGSAINPDPFAFPGQSPFPSVPLFI